MTVNQTDRVALHLHNEPLPLSAPFRISGYVFDSMPATVVTLSDGVHEGRGEGAGVYYLDDRPEGMLATLEVAARRDRVRPHPRASCANCCRRAAPATRSTAPCGNSSRSVRALRVWKLAGLETPRPLLTTFTVGADEPGVMATAAQAYKQARAIKLKLTGDADLDIERVRAVRAARPDVWLGGRCQPGLCARHACATDARRWWMTQRVAARAAVPARPRGGPRRHRPRRSRSPPTKACRAWTKWRRCRAASMSSTSSSTSAAA